MAVTAIHAIESFASGGIEAGLRTLITHGFYEGCDLHVIGLIRGGGGPAQRKIADLIGDDHVRFLLDEPRFPDRGHRRILWQRFRREVRALAPDVIISSSPRTDLITRMITLRHPKVKLATFEHWAKIERRFGHRMRARVTSLRCDIVLGDTPATLEATNSHYWGARPQCYVPLIISEPGAPRLPNTPDCFELLSVGRLDEQKNYPELIRALALLKDRRDFRLTIAGEGPQREELLDLARVLKVNDRLHLPGFLSGPDELRSLRGRSHIYLQPSRIEGVGLGIVEALAAGMIVLATDVGGARDYGVDGRNMLKVKGFSAADIAARLDYAMENYGRIAAAMSQSAIDTAREIFGEAVVKRHWQEARRHLMSPRFSASAREA